MRIASLGHAVFAATLIGLGVLGATKGDFAPIWGPVPKTVPAREALAYASSFVLLACGIGLMWRRSAAASARVLFGFCLVWLLVLRAPRILLAFGVATWFSACETAVMVAAAWVLDIWFAGGRGMRIARALFGVALIPFGLAHFLYLENTAPLVPAWLPAHVAWAYFTGAAFIAAGVAVLTGVLARLAAALVALQIGLFTLLVWVPIVAKGQARPYQWTEFVVSWALTAAAWVVADSWRLGHPPDARLAQ